MHVSHLFTADRLKDDKVGAKEAEMEERKLVA